VSEQGRVRATKRVTPNEFCRRDFAGAEHENKAFCIGKRVVLTERSE
jgi:hypothetical protein